MGKAAEKADEQEGAAVMAKNRIKISILGSDYIIASEEIGRASCRERV